MSPRYAVYLAPPPDSALWSFGSAVLGYDADTGAAVAPPELRGFDAETWAELTTDPRRYGFHGTLKPPFRLVEGASRADLLAAVARVAGGQHAFDLPPLEVHEIGPFIALTPSAAVPALHDLADCLVEDLDTLRAPLTPQEIARRRPEGLSARQRGYLDTLGYPYVRDEFRFHMTLTGPLDPETRVHALNALADAYAASGASLPLKVEDVALYCQEAPSERFRIIARIPLRPV